MEIPPLESNGAIGSDGRHSPDNNYTFPYRVPERRKFIQNIKFLIIDLSCFVDLNIFTTANVTRHIELSYFGRILVLHEEIKS